MKAVLPTVGDDNNGADIGDTTSGNNDINNPVDEYLQCLSYCDIHPKGIDNDCEVICIERHLKTNYW